MEYFKTNQNKQIPAILYGTAWKKERTPDLVEDAILAGFKGIDTAAQPKHYKEDLVGIGLARAYEKGVKREDLFLQTKFTPIGGQDTNDMPYNSNDSFEKQVVDSYESSLKNFRTSYLDALVLHSPLQHFEETLSVWKAMECFFDERRVHHLGVSNCYNFEYLKCLYDTVEVKPSFVQNRFYVESGYDKEIRAWCNEKGIIYQSFWSLTANPHILQNITLIKLASRYGKTTAQVFYRFLNQINILPLIGTTSKTHMQEDLDIFSFFLEDEEVSSILRMLES